MIGELTGVLLDNQAFFRSDKTQCEFVNISKSMVETLIKLEPLVNEIRSFAGKYDLDELTPGNGYRSFIFTIEKAFEKSLNVCKKVHQSRESFFFRKKFYQKCVRLKKKSFQVLIICEFLENLQLTVNFSAVL